MTLFNRLHGRECRKDAFSPLQRLSQTQENQLTEWVLIQDALGLPPTHSQIKQFAQRIDAARVNGASTEVIRPWFNNFFLPEVQAIKPEHRYNMDEAGIMEGNGLVDGNAEKRSLQKKTPGSRAWTSFIDYWQFTATKNGWTSDQTAVEWLEKVFIPRTQPSDFLERRLLVLDGHGSHETVDFMYLCYQHKIHLLFLPPHTSHVLQPLDLSVFSPLKHYYRKQVGFLSLLTDSSPVGKQNFLSCYQSAREQALTASTIKGGWKATGLWPVSVAKPLLSPLLLENSNKRKKDAKNAHNALKSPFTTCEWQSDASQIAWSTPRRPQDLKVQVLQFNQLDDDVPTKRLLFRKITKGFDEKDGLLAKAQLQIHALETQLAAVKPKKRKRVETSPNSRFADIDAIRRAQEEVKAAENEECDGTEAELSDVDYTDQ
ncbi:transposase [Purpureocillium lilacinum]|uniref:Transposase n=1 Tax=Purpureocillium lilacinum TaxID=33203 RepID=A0A179FIW8_PURLI|nr:transposase [Purpureocillium lilacinum]